MKSKLFLLASCLAFSFFACKNEDKPAAAKPEDDIDAAREFIRAALDGQFDQARKLLLQDSSNTNYMDVAERNYEKSNADVKNGYRSSSINIHQISPLNDSTTIVIFSNSFKNDHDTLKVLKTGQQWRVDLKYLYEHDMDTARFLHINTDSLK